MGENPVQLLDERRRRHWVVPSLEASSLETTLGLGDGPLSTAASAGLAAPPCGVPNGCLLPHVGAATFLLVFRGRRLVAFRLLAVGHDGWRCYAIVSAVWNNVREWRLQHRQPGMTWLAAAHGGLDQRG
jgi:hypothetical protein